jgi:hypothetical protein
MTYARWYMIINGLMLAGYGIYCLLQPHIVADLTAMTVSSTALTELRAMYGGVQTALGIYFLMMAFKPRCLEGALIGLIMLYGGLCSARALGMLLLGGDDYNTPAFAFEFVDALLGLGALIQVRKARAA